MTPDTPIKVALLGPSPSAAASVIAEHAGELATMIPVPDPSDDAQMGAALAQAHVIIGGLPDRDLAMPQLRMVHATGAGIDHLPLHRLADDVVVCNAYEHGQGMAEHVIAMMLMVRRSILVYDRDLRRGHWNKQRHGPFGLYSEMREQTMGIVGFGTIGKALVPLAQAFGMDVEVVRSRSHDGPPPAGVRRQVGPDQLDEVLAASDVVVLALPLNDETRGIIAREQLKAMRPTAILINVARGPVVDEDALYEALVDKTIAGAGIDVWYRYPQADEDILPSTRPFHELDNVVMTPHTAGWTMQTARDRWVFIGRNIARLAQGQVPLNVVHGTTAD